MSCREATFDDLPAIARVNVAAWQAAYAGLMPDEFLSGMKAESLLPRWQQWFTTFPLMLVVESHGEIAGYCIYGKSRDAEAAPGTGEIIAINIHPGSWREGLGTALFDEALARLHALGFSEATLWVLGGNDRARRFYEARGWRTDGAEKQDSALTGSPIHEVRYRGDLP